MRDWAHDQMTLNAVDKVFELHDHLTQALHARLGQRDGHVLELETAQVLFPLDVLRTLMTDIAMERRGSWGGDAASAAPPKELVASLGRALDLLASDTVFALACEILDSAKSEALKDVVVPYLRRWCPNQEGTLATMLQRAGPSLGKFIIELFMEMKTERAIQGLESAFSNPNLEVKLAALAAMGEKVGERAREEITTLLDSLDVTIRMNTLELVASLGVTAAGPFLVRRVVSDAFHELSVEERKLWLSTICTLKAERGETLAVEVLSKRRLLSNEASEQSRAIAAEALARFDSAETLEALQNAAKQRWGTTAQVREAALKSLAAIEARRSKKSSVMAAVGESKA
jgi:hypothetical protein